MKRTTQLSLIVATALLASACDDPKPEPKTAHDQAGSATATPPPSKPQPTAASEGDDSGPVNIDDRIAKMCALPKAQFDFNSAALPADARAVLDALAKCFSSGPAKDKSMNIVGHADPRGETEFNFGLGQRRAAAVATYIVKAGVTETRVASSSRGELEATGTNEAGWSKDRRVEIFLAE